MRFSPVSDSPLRAALSESSGATEVLTGAVFNLVNGDRHEVPMAIQRVACPGPAARCVCVCVFYFFLPRAGAVIVGCVFLLNLFLR